MGYCKRHQVRIAYLLAAIALHGPARNLGAQGIPPFFVSEAECVVNVLNRSAAVQPDGTWVVVNIPANIGQVRARKTCLVQGMTLTGESELFTVPPNGAITLPEIPLNGQRLVPDRLQIVAESEDLPAGQTAQYTVTAHFPEGAVDVTGLPATSVFSSRADVVSFAGPGVLVGNESGVAILSAIHEGVLGLTRIRVTDPADGDSDGDGVSDDQELANGLDPFDPTDVFLDLDGDGLSTRDELLLFGTDPGFPDSDEDGILDGEEVRTGEDGFTTNPLAADTDGDGVTDLEEILAGGDPTDPSDGGGTFVAIDVEPPSVALTFNTLLGEASRQLTVFGVLGDGSRVDITPEPTTSYRSSDLTVCSFGATPGEIFAGQSGECTITVEAGSRSTQVPVEVDTFVPTALASLSVPGATNIDVGPGFAYVTTSSGDFHVIDTSSPAILNLISTTPLGAPGLDVLVAGDWAFVSGELGVLILDITNRSAPVLATSIPTGGAPRGLALAGDLLLVAGGDPNLQVFDIGDRARPRPLGSLDVAGSPTGIAFDLGRKVAVLTLGSGGLATIDLAVLSRPTAAAAVPMSGSANDLSLANNTAVIADSSLGMTPVDLTSPTSPIVGDPLPRPLGGLLNGISGVGSFVFGADLFFVNGVPIAQLQSSGLIPRAILDFSQFGDPDAQAVAADHNFVYLLAGGQLFVGRYLRFAGGVPPAIDLEVLADEAVAGAPLDIVASVSDGVGVAEVVFLANGVELLRDRVPPYEAVLIPAESTGEIVVEARAIDFEGLSATTGEVRILTSDGVDSDGDGIPDEIELRLWGTDPSSPDTDGDQLPDGLEIALVPCLDPTLGDTDDDGSPDLFEDCDDDGLSNGRELAIGLDPGSRDQDGDGIDDASELRLGCDPSSPDPLVAISGSVNPSDAAAGRRVFVQILEVDHPIEEVDANSDFTIQNVPACGRALTAVAATSGPNALRGVATFDPASATQVGILLGPARHPIAERMFQTERFPVGNNVKRSIVADLDGDGIRDAVVVRSRALELLQGDLAGAFHNIAQLNLPNLAVFTDLSKAGRDVALADVNGDRLLDLVAPVGTSIGTWRGEPGPSFETTELLSGWARGVAEIDGIDANRDLYADLLVLDDAGCLVALVGEGTGAFQTNLEFGCGYSRASVGDWNNDGIDDAIALSSSSPAFDVFLGLEGGGWAPALSGEAGSQPASEFAIGPAGTGFVVLSESGNRGDPTTITSITPDESGDPRVRSTVLQAGCIESGLSIEDLTADGILDAIIEQSCTGDEVLRKKLLRGSSLSTFVQSDGLESDHGGLPGRVPPEAAFARDVGGRPAFLGTTHFRFLDEGWLTAYRWDSPDATSPPIEARVGSTSVFIRDVTGDGLADIVSSSGILKGDGRGRFLPLVDVTFSDVELLDLEASSSELIIFANGLGLELYTSDGEENYEFTSELPLELQFFGETISAADFDGDGEPEILALSRDRDLFVVEVDEASLSLDREVVLDGTVLGYADIDDNGQVDILVVDSIDDLTGTLAIFAYRNPGDGVAHPRELIVESRAGWIADVDSDGHVDLLLIDHLFNVNWMPGTGAGDFGSARSTGVRLPDTGIGAALTALRVEDIDGDGVSDLALLNGATLTLAQGEGAGQFGEARHVLLGRGRQMAIGDIDSDGLPDIVSPQSGYLDGRWVSILRRLREFRPPAPSDSDGDGIEDWREDVLGIDPHSSDTDSDAIPDGTEVGLFPCVAPDSADSDRDGEADADEDCDEDGLSNGDELEIGTNPALADTDGDGELDGDEFAAGCDPTRDERVTLVGSAVFDDLGGVPGLSLAVDRTPTSSTTGPRGEFSVSGVRSCPTSRLSVRGTHMGFGFGGDFDIVGPITDGTMDLGPLELIRSDVFVVQLGIHDRPDVCRQQSGQFLVVWEQACERSANGCIQARVFDSQGSPIGEDFTVRELPFADDFGFSGDNGPKVACAGAEGFVVVWPEADYQYDVAPAIRGRRVSDEGASLGQVFEISADGVGPDIEWIGERELVAIWENQGLEGTVLNVDGAAVSPTFQVTSDELGSGYGSSDVSAASSTDGNFVVSWVRRATGLEERRVRAQIIAKSGQLVGGPIEVGGPSSRGTEVAVRQDGEFVVVWRDYGDDSSYDYNVIARAFGSNGVALGAEFEVQAPGTAYTSFVTHPAQISRGANDFVVSWSCYTYYGDCNGAHAFVRQTDIDGNLQDVTQVDDDVPFGSYSEDVRVVVPSDATQGEFVVVWSGFEDYTNVPSLFARILGE